MAWADACWQSATWRAFAVARAPEDVELLHDLALGLLLRQELLVDGLKSDELACKSMDGQVDLSERAFSHHLADLIVLGLSLRRLALFQECKLDLLLDLEYVAGARR